MQMAATPTLRKKPSTVGFLNYESVHLGPLAAGCSLVSAANQVTR